MEFGGKFAPQQRVDGALGGGAGAVETVAATGLFLALTATCAGLQLAGDDDDDEDYDRWWRPDTVQMEMEQQKQRQKLLEQMPMRQLQRGLHDVRDAPKRGDRRGKVW